MATTVRNLTRLVALAMPLLHNQLRLDILKVKSGAIVHATPSAAITVADSAADAGSFLLINACQASYNLHCASACDATTGVGAHYAADATNPDASPVATDLASGYTIANAIKAAFNAHRVLLTSHTTADAGAITAADANSSGSLITLVNDIKAKLNAHYAKAFVSGSLLVVPA